MSSTDSDIRRSRWESEALKALSDEPLHWNVWAILFKHLKKSPVPERRLALRVLNKISVQKVMQISEDSSNGTRVKEKGRSLFSSVRRHWVCEQNWGGGSCYCRVLNVVLLTKRMTNVELKDVALQSASEFAPFIRYYQSSEVTAVKMKTCTTYMEQMIRVFIIFVGKLVSKGLLHYTNISEG